MENPLLTWIEEDTKLSNALLDIDELGLSSIESAKIAFFKIAELYNLPKNPEDITEENYAEHEKDNLQEPRSVVEEMAIINFMASKDDDIKSLVLSALHNIYFKTYIDINEAAIIHFGTEKNIPNDYTVYFFGSDINAVISFIIKENKTWIEAGAFMMKEVKRTVNLN
jgi:hypothetical protein